MMGLNNKQLESVIKDPTAFYLYDKQVGSEDLIKIIEGTFPKTPFFYLFPVIKTICSLTPELITDDVKYVMLQKVNIDNVTQIIDMFNVYRISIPDAFIDKFIKDLCALNDSSTKNLVRAKAIIRHTKPRLSDETNIILVEKFYNDKQLSNYLLDQLIADKKFKFILEQKKLFDYSIQTKPKQMAQVVRKLIDAQELDFIAQQEKRYFWFQKGILFSDDLIEKMLALCLKAHKAELVFYLDKLFSYVTKHELGLAKKAVHQLFSDAKYEYIVHSENVLTYIIKYEPELLKKIPNELYEQAIMHANKQYLYNLIKMAPLPNIDLEFAYIKRNNNAEASFPPKSKLSRETLSYIKIIKEPSKSGVDFTKLSPRLISALIDCKFDNKADWYRVIKQLLIANPYLDEKHIQQMLPQGPKVAELVQCYWKNTLSKAKTPGIVLMEKQKER